MTVKILGICGSLRSGSSNCLFLDTVKTLYLQHQWQEIKLNELPFFDPELQYSENLPQVVQEMREMASGADLILVVTPEYAHGPPGVLKNAFEWLFFEGTLKKPVLLLIGAAQGEHTRDQLVEILSTMDFKISKESCYILKNPRAHFFEEGGFKSKEAEVQLKKFLDQFMN